MLNNTILKDGSRLGDNVSVIKAFSMLADKLSEDEIIKGEGTGYVTASEIEKEILNLLRMDHHTGIKLILTTKRQWIRCLNYVSS